MRVKIWDRGSVRIKRGGAWGSVAPRCRAVARYEDAPLYPIVSIAAFYHSYRFGFRLVRRSK